MIGTAECTIKNLFECKSSNNAMRLLIRYGCTLYTVYMLHMCVCIYVICIHILCFIYMYACMYVCMYVCTCICMYVTHVFINNPCLYA